MSISHLDPERTNGRSYPKPLVPAVANLQAVVECDPALLQLASSMFEQIPYQSPYNQDPSGRPQIRNYQHMLQVLNDTIQGAPGWDDSLLQCGYIGFPINVILQWPMSTPAGKAFFLNQKINVALKGILTAWAEYLSSPASTAVLSSKDGWLSPAALKAIAEESKGNSKEPLTFEQIFLCDPSLPHYGYKSWDDFFTRRFRSGVRPTPFPVPSAASKGTDPTIINACESRPYRLSTNVSLHDSFWLKSQAYSLIDMLAHDPLAHDFVGGTVYQAYLSALSYHRWHSPVSGRIVRAFVKEGTYYAVSPSLDLNSAKDDSLTPSQGYLAEVATRAIIFIEADNSAIGLICFMGIGMAECSTCEITVTEGQRVEKGEEIGMFHYGGSTYCLLLRGGVEVEWVEGAKVEEGADSRGGANLCVNSLLARVKT